MPFYEYQCKNCGHDLEAMQKINDPPLKKCPHCGKSQLQRLMSAPVFRLKGGGWYVTDFRDSGKKDGKKAAGEAAPATGVAAPASGESGAKSEGGAAKSDTAASTPAASSSTLSDSSSGSGSGSSAPAAPAGGAKSA